MKVIIKYVARYSLLILIALLSACSSSYDNYVYQRPANRTLPEIPEIASVVVEPEPRYVPPPVKPKVTPYKPKVQKYTPSKGPSNVITQKEVASVVEEKRERDRLEEAFKNAEVETDPYADIPDSSTAAKRKTVVAPTVASTNKPQLGKVKPAKAPATSTARRETSSAVKSLLFKARADLAIGRTSAAISELERGLRIEPQNSELWYQLAKAQYSKKNYSQSISMAKKSIRYTNRDYEIAKNWILIKKAGLKSGDTVVVKEALDYFKINP